MMAFLMFYSKFKCIYF